MKKNLVKKGQRWRDKVTGKIIHIDRKHGGNGHWAVLREEGMHRASRHIHEGTIQKFYELVAQ